MSWRKPRALTILVFDVKKMEQSQKTINHFALVDISKLHRHEEIRRAHYAELRKEIMKNGYVEPILVEAEHCVILDGHHRFEILKDLGYKKIPAILVCYSHPCVKLCSWRDDVCVTKEEVIRRGKEGDLYPPKTSRHIIEGIKKMRVPLTALM